jgi:4'-phosphopantetheinyl transferase
MDAWRRDFDEVTLVVGTDLDAVAVIAGALGVDAASVSLSHLCPNCGSTAHGRPLIAGPAELSVVGVSIAHSQGVDAVAINRVGSIGVDLESISQIARASVSPALLHPREIADTPTDVAHLWTTKEAVLKLVGRGLRLDPRELRVDAGQLVLWPAGLFGGSPPRIRSLSVDDDLVASIAW